jgi:GTP-dependent phosphoenolpyruvate carboxykinase
MPTPFRKSHVQPITRPIATPPPTSRPKNQPSGVFEVKTIPAIFCVTDLKVWPGAITAYSPVRGSIMGSTIGSCMGPLVAIMPTPDSG